VRCRATSLHRRRQCYLDLIQEFSSTCLGWALFCSDSRCVGIPEVSFVHAEYDPVYLQKYVRNNIRIFKLTVSPLLSTIKPLIWDNSPQVNVKFVMEDSFTVHFL
jgi:hypothetical protein